jgi:hypothetical protein
LSINRTPGAYPFRLQLGGMSARQFESRTRALLREFRS